MAVRVLESISEFRHDINPENELPPKYYYACDQRADILLVYKSSNTTQFPKIVTFLVEILTTLQHVGVANKTITITYSFAHFSQRNTDYISFLLCFTFVHLSIILSYFEKRILLIKVLLKFLNNVYHYK